MCDMYMNTCKVWTEQYNSLVMSHNELSKLQACTANLKKLWTTNIGMYNRGIRGCLRVSEGVCPCQQGVHHALQTRAQSSADCIKACLYQTKCIHTNYINGPLNALYYQNNQIPINNLQTQEQCRNAACSFKVQFLSLCLCLLVSRILASHRAPWQHKSPATRFLFSDLR